MALFPQEKMAEKLPVAPNHPNFSPFAVAVRAV
jgi:hypothetical protein